MLHCLSVACAAMTTADLNSVEGRISETRNTRQKVIVGQSLPTSPKDFLRRREKKKKKKNQGTMMRARMRRLN